MHHGNHNECARSAGVAGGRCESCHLSTSSAGHLMLQSQARHTDCDTNGIGIGAISLRLNGGGTFYSAGNDAGLLNAAVTADGGQRVEASPPQ